MERERYNFLLSRTQQNQILLMLNSSASASGSNHTARRRIGGMGPVEIVAEKLLFGARDCAAVAETASQFQRQAASSLGQVVEKQSSSFGKGSLSP